MQRIDGRPAFVEAKTILSRRTLHLRTSVIGALRVQRDRQSFERLAAGERWKEYELVFAATIGTPLNPSNVTHRFQALVEATGIPRQRFHDLRHCAASLLLAQGAHPQVIMQTLGHD
jgi:integrase